MLYIDNLFIADDDYVFSFVDGSYIEGRYLKHFRKHKNAG